MFDAQYFSHYVLDQIDQLGSGSCSLELHLHNGAIFRIRSIAQVCPGYVLLEVYPPEGVTDESKAARKKPGGNDEVFHDRVAVAYGSIAYTFLTVKEPVRKGEIGFLRPGAKSP